MIRHRLLYALEKVAHIGRDGIPQGVLGILLWITWALQPKHSACRRTMTGVQFSV